jgi:outer membrane protein
MMIMKTASIAVVLAFVSTMSFGQDTLVLTFADAVKIAMKNNVNLNQEKNNLITSEVQRNSSVMAMLPGVSIDGGGTRAKGPQQNPENGNLEDFTNDSFNASISAGITIFNGFRVLNTMAQARHSFRAQLSNVERTEQLVVSTVTTQYLQVLLDQELLRIAEETLKGQQTLLEQIRESVRLGARAEADFYTQDALVKGSEVRVINAKVTLENDKANLSQTIQLEPGVEFTVQLPDLNQKSADVTALSVDSLYTIALQQRPDLKQLEYQTDAFNAGYRAASAGYLPRLTAFASYGSNYYSNLRPDPRFGSFSNQFLDVLPNSAIGFNFSIPIYDRSVTRYNRVFSKVQRDNARLRHENLKKSVMIDVKRSYNNYVAAIQTYRAAQSQFQAAELAHRVQSESYLLGVSDQVALANATTVYVQGASALAQAEVTLYFQQIMLDYALGTLNPDDVQ